MKKRLAVLFLSVVLAVSVTACNSGSSEASESTPSKQTSSVASVSESTKPESSKEESSAASETPASNIDAKELFQKKFIDVMKDGKYYMKMTVDTSSLGGTSSKASSETSGVPESITMTVAADVKNKKIYMDFGMSMMGFDKIIVADGKQWMLSDDKKTAYYTQTTEDVESQLESMSSNLFAGSAVKTDDMEYVSDSEEEFNGKKCIAVVYKVPADINTASGVSLASTSGLDTEQTYYFDKETQDLVGIKVNVGTTESTMVIDEFTSELSSGLFDIPSDYTKTDISKMMNSTSNS